MKVSSWVERVQAETSRPLLLRWVCLVLAPYIPIVHDQLGTPGYRFHLRTQAESLWICEVVVFLKKHLPVEMFLELLHNFIVEMVGNELPFRVIVFTSFASWASQGMPRVASKLVNQGS